MLSTAQTRADVIDYAFARFVDYQQTADNTQPTAPTGARIFAQFANDQNSNFDSVSISGGVAGLVLGSDDGGLDWMADQSFATPSAMNEIFPTTATYTLNATGDDTQAPFSADLEFSDNTSAPLVPFFTGNVVTEAQNLDSSEMFTFTWSDPFTALDPNANQHFFSIWDTNDNEIFHEDEFGASPTSIVVPGGLLAPGTQYNAFITVASLEVSGNDGEPQGFVGFASETSLQFATAAAAVPEPTSFWLLGCLAVLGPARRRKSV